MAIVFQYGSNSLNSEINSEARLRGDAQFLDIAETVEEFELAFDVWSEKRKCAAADIVRKPGGRVWGALYEVPDDLIGRDTARSRGRKSFDAIEGQGTNYEREMIEVRRPGGQVVPALTYTVIKPMPGLRTNEKYVAYIVAGLRERDVNADYIARVKAIAIANNPDIAALVEAM
jgi:Gamma-glutamyl cyclotransferase, AIG2-like